MITIENKGKDIYLFGRDKDNKPYIREDNTFIPYFYYKDKDGEYTSLFGDKLKKINVDLPSDVPKIRDRYEHFEADIIYVNRYMIDRLEKIEKENIRKCYIDIELYTKEGLSTIEDCNNQINCISCYDNFDNLIITFVLNPNKTKIDNPFVLSFDNEKQLLQTFLVYINEKNPDILIAWNGDNFDFPYLINRMRKLGLEVNLLGRGEKSYAIKEKGWWHSKVWGRVLFDLMYGYKKLVTGHSGQRESYALEYISQYELGEGKEKFDGSLDDLYEKDLNKFINYNIKDVELLKLLDDKLNIIEYFDEIRRYAFCKFEDVFLNSRVIDCLILKFCSGKYILPSKIKRDLKKGMYKGAFVYQPQKGLFKNIAVGDLKSLYPSIIVSCNLSPETILPKKEEDCISVFDKFFYRKDIKGVLPQIIIKLFTERKKYKDLMKKEGYGSIEYKKYDNIQYAVKTIMNAMYGVLGHAGFRLYRKEIAETITFTGREIIKFSMEFLKKEDYKIIYGDTDSVFFTKEILTADLVKKDIEKLNKEYDVFAKQLYIHNHIFEMEFEKIFKTIFFTEAKKRYAGRLMWLNGKEVDIITITGFESRRSDSPQIIRDFQKELFKLILYEKNEEELKKYIEEFRNNFKNFREELGIPSTITRPFSKYINLPIHIRAAKYGNKILNTNFRFGDKLKWVYILNGRENVIAFKNKLPEDIKIDYDKMEERLLHNKINTTFECLNWAPPFTNMFTKSKINDNNLDLNNFNKKIEFEDDI